MSFNCDVSGQKNVEIAAKKRLEWKSGTQKRKQKPYEVLFIIPALTFHKILVEKGTQ